MKNYRPVILILLGVGLLILVKFIFFPAQSPPPAGAGKGGQRGPADVTAFIASEQKIDNTFYTNGTLLPNEKADIQCEIAGVLSSLDYPEGKKVQKGQLLATLQDAEWRAQVKKLEAQVTLAQQKKDRYEKLLKSGGISQEEWETAIAELAALQAETDAARAQMAKTQIRAPFAGVLGFRKVSPGSYISNGTVLGDIVQVSPLKIGFSIPEKYAGIFSAGSHITFTVDGSKKIYEANVTTVEPEVDINTRTVSFHALYPNTQGELKPGLFAEVTVYPEGRSTGILIPTQAIIPVLKGKKVFVVRSGKAMGVEIETGLRTARMIQVIRGLQVGDTVITTGIMGLSDGSPVKLLDVAKAR